MAANSHSPMLWLFYLQLTLLLGPGVVALLDLWLHNRRMAKSDASKDYRDGNVQNIRSPNEEVPEDRRRAS